MDLSELFTVNEKAFFALDPDPEGELYACLVKKVKDPLMAVVVSNRDKNKIDIGAAGALYFLSDWDGETWITPMRIAQKHSYPLIILNAAGEPEPISRRLTAEPPAPPEEIESIDSDHMAGSFRDEEGGFAHPLMGEVTSATDETPGERFFPGGRFEGESPAQGEELSDEELASEPEEDMYSIDDTLSGEQDIDTSELEERLEADIRDTFGAEPRQDADDDLSDMVISRERTLPLDDEDKPSLPFVSEDIESGGADFFADTRIERPDTPTYRYPSQTGRKTPAPARDKAGFHDFFGLRALPVDAEKSNELADMIETGENPLEALGTQAHLPGGALPEGLAGPARQAFEKILNRMARIEETIFEGGDKTPEKKASEGWMDAICLGLDEKGARLVLDSPMREGDYALIAVDRPWRPALKFFAVASAGFPRRAGDIEITPFRFTAIHPDSVEAITGYLTGGGEFFSRLREASDY